MDQSPHRVRGPRRHSGRAAQLHLFVAGRFFSPEIVVGRHLRMPRLSRSTTDCTDATDARTFGFTKCWAGSPLARLREARIGANTASGLIRTRTISHCARFMESAEAFLCAVDPRDLRFRQHIRRRFDAADGQSLGSGFAGADGLATDCGRHGFQGAPTPVAGKRHLRVRRRRSSGQHVKAFPPWPRRGSHSERRSGRVAMMDFVGWG